MQTNDLTFYVHDLDEAIEWYTREFGVDPSEVEEDCASFNTGSLRVNLVLMTPSQNTKVNSSSSLATSLYFKHRHHELFEFC